jgi:hypothetical protein
VNLLAMKKKHTPTLIAQRSAGDVRAGDICRLHDTAGEWTPIARSRRRLLAYDFARLPAADEVRPFDVDDVAEIVESCESVRARRFWRETILPRFGA